MKTSVPTVGVLNEIRDTTWIKVKSVRRIPTWAGLFDAALFASVLFNDIYRIRMPQAHRAAAHDAQNDLEAPI